MTADRVVTAVEPFVTGLRYAEGLRWHDGGLWFSDLIERRVLRQALGGPLEVVHDDIGEPSGLGFLPDGRLLIVERGRAEILVSARLGSEMRSADLAGSADAAAPEVFAALAPLGTVRPNDMVTDDEGWSYVGALGHEYRMGEEHDGLTGAEEGTLVAVGPDGTAQVVATGLGCPNGMVITPDRRTLVLAETYGSRLLAYDRHDDGTLGPPRVLATFGGPFPDGLAIDEEGCVWVGTGRAFLRVDPKGRTVAEVILPGLTAIACALGGPDRRTLFMAGCRMSMEEFVQGRSEGAIMMTEVGTAGAGWP